MKVVAVESVLRFDKGEEVHSEERIDVNREKVYSCDG